MTRPKILFITTYYPYNYDTGGNQRTYNLFNGICEQGDVDVVMASPEGWVWDSFREDAAQKPNVLGLLEWKLPASVRAMRKLSTRIADKYQYSYEWLFANFRPDRELVQWRKEHLDGKPYDLVVVRSIWSLCKMDAYGIAPILLDLDDLDHFVSHAMYNAMYQRKSSMLKRVFWGAARYVILREQIARHAKRCAHAFFMSEEDIEFCPFTTGTVLRHPPPLGREVPNYCGEGAPNLIVVLADFQYGPYLEGMRYFIQNSWPIVRAAVPEAKLRLLGRILDQDRAAWADVDGVEMLGFVPPDEIGEHYREAAFTMALAHWGTGAKTKIVESFMYGKTCLLTHHSQHGYRSRLLHGDSVLIGNTDEELAEHCITWLKNPELCRKMAARGREIVMETYTMEAFQAAAAEGVARALERGRQAKT